MVRYQLNKIVVDTEAGPHRNQTIVFLGSNRGTILKFLIVPNQDNTVTSSHVFLEELEGFNPDKCAEDSSAGQAAAVPDSGSGQPHSAAGLPLLRG
ncbi:sema6b [Pungitius sinensis]